MMDKSKLKVLFALHLMLMIYSMSGICSKMASQQDFLSFKFCLFYAIIIFLLGYYHIHFLILLALILCDLILCRLLFLHLPITQTCLSFIFVLSFKFCLFYAIIIFLLGFYAIGWQQIIKRLPLTTAFANKAVTVVWGIIWGAVFFHESITVGKVIGAALVIVGVVIYARADEGEVNE